MIELIHGLHRVGLDQWQVLAAGNRNTLLAEARGAAWYEQHVVGAVPMSGRRSPLMALQNEYALRRRAQSATIVHRTYHPVFDLLPRTTSVIETVHDLWDFVARDERGPRAVLRRNLKRRALERADRIVCVSRSTRDYLGNLWPKLADRAIVIPHGTSRLSDRPVAVDRVRPFFLFVGRRDRYKNFSVLLDAMSRLGSSAELICFGGGPFSIDERQLIAHRGLSSDVHQYGGDDHVLAGHYVAARALLYPSRHEGFGLPLLEAMSLGCPVVASPLTSLPEVGGDAAFYADADAPEAWAQTMTMLLENGEARNRAVDAGTARAASFSWDKTAQQHVALYAELGLG